MAPRATLPSSLLLHPRPTLGAPRSIHTRSSALRSRPFNHHNHNHNHNHIQQRTMIAAPRPGSGPLTERRPDRALPDIPRPWRVWLRTFPIFLAIMTASALALFNYQKQSSSVVASTMYALRTSPRGREVLGDEIYFRDAFPWIWGELNQLHGRIDIRFGVKGTKGRGMMRFRSERKQRMGYFETKEWSLTTEDGRVIQLLDKGKQDPFQDSVLQVEGSAQEV